MKQSRRKALTTIRIKKMVRRRLQENLNPQKMKATSARVTEVMDELRKQYGEGVGIAKAQICAVVDKYSEALKEIPRPRKRRVVKYSTIDIKYR